MHGPSFEKHGPIAINCRTDARLRMRLLSQAVRECLPYEWLPAINANARALAAAAALDDLANTRTPTVLPSTRANAKGDYYAGLLDRYAGARDADMSEAEIRDKAQYIADRARRLRFAVWPDGTGAWDAWARMCEFVAKHGGVLKITRKCYRLDY